MAFGKFAKAVVRLEIEGLEVYRGEVWMPVPPAGVDLPDKALESLARQTALKAMPAFRLADAAALRAHLAALPIRPAP